MCTFKLPIYVIEQIDKYRKHFLWDKGDVNRRGGCLVAWKNACMSKDQGGLGIIDLRTQNTAFLFINFIINWTCPQLILHGNV